MGSGPSSNMHQVWRELHAVQGFCSRLKSRVLAEALGTLYGGEGSMSDFPVVALILMLAFMHKKSSGYPIGGLLEFARAIERRYRELGGRIRYNARVDKILVEEDRAVGLVCGGEGAPGRRGHLLRRRPRHPGHLAPLHRQLAGQLRRVPAHPQDGKRFIATD